MKTIIIAILMLIVVSEARSQFGLTTSAGYGISVNSKLEYSLFQSVITVTPRYQFGDLIVGGQSNAVKSDSNTTMFNGATAFWKAYKFDPERSVSVSGHYLIGFEGDFVWGGGVSYDSGPVGFDVTFSQEYNRREFWCVAGVRYALIPFSN